MGASKLRQEPGAERGTPWGRQAATFQHSLDRTVVRAQHLWHDLGIGQFQQCQSTVSQDVVNAGTIVKMPGSCYVTPASVGFILTRVQKAESINKEVLVLRISARLPEETVQPVAPRMLLEGFLKVRREAG